MKATTDYQKKHNPHKWHVPQLYSHKGYEQIIVGSTGRQNEGKFEAVRICGDTDITFETVWLDKNCYEPINDTVTITFTP